MKTDFEIRSLDLSLQRLLDDGIIKNENQKRKLFDLYRKDERNYNVIHQEIYSLRFDKELLEKKLKTNELVSGKEAATVDVNKKEEYKLSLENVTDFEKDGKSYIKIHYPYPYDNIRIIENRTDPHQTGKERFESLKDTQNIISVDGTVNATSIFEQTLVRDCHEVKLKDLKEITTAYEFSKLSIRQKEIVVGTMRSLVNSLPLSEGEKKLLLSKPTDIILSMLGKKVWISSEENIVVISTPNDPLKDEVKKLDIIKKVNSDGSQTKTYSLKPVDETGYKYNAGNYEASDQNESYEKSSAEDLDKEMGSALKPKEPWKKKRKKEAAFISILWFAIFSGTVFSIILMSLIYLMINK